MIASKKQIVNYTLDQLEIASEDLEIKVKLENLYFPENENKVETNNVLRCLIMGNKIS